MNEKEKEVFYEKNSFWKWLCLGLIALIIIFGFNMCNPFNKTFEDIKVPRYDRETNEFDFESGKEDFQGSNGQNTDIEPYYIAVPSNKYIVNYRVTLNELSKRWHIPVSEIVRENPGIKPTEPIKPGTDIDVPENGKLEEFEAQVLKYTNQARAQQGLKALVIDKTLNNCAQSKSKDMSDRNYFSHQSPTYGSPFDMMRQFNISYKSAAENIAKGQTTPRQVVDSWLNSPGHRQNIMGNFTHIGIGYEKSGNLWTQMFISK